MPVHNHYFLDGQGRIGTPGGVQALQLQGPILQVLVSVTALYAQTLQRLGRPIPQPVSGYALLDTGAALCAVDEEIISSLGVAPVGYQLTQGATGMKPVVAPTFPASLSFPNTNLPNITFQDFIGLPLRTQGLVAIIGRSVLAHFVMIYNGPSGMVTLSY